MVGKYLPVNRIGYDNTAETYNSYFGSEELQTTTDGNQMDAHIQFNFPVLLEPSSEDRLIGTGVAVAGREENGAIVQVTTDVYVTHLAQSQTVRFTFDWIENGLKYDIDATYTVTTV
jgi:hypothetical protein